MYTTNNNRNNNSTTTNNHNNTQYRDNFNDDDDDDEENDDTYNNTSVRRSSVDDDDVVEMTDQRRRQRSSQTSPYGPDMDYDDNNDDLNPNLYPLEQTVIPQPYHERQRSSSRSRCWYLVFGFGCIVGFGLIIGFIYQYNQHTNNIGFENTTTSGLTNTNNNTIQDSNIDGGSTINNNNNNNQEDLGSETNDTTTTTNNNNDQQPIDDTNNDSGTTQPTTPNDNNINDNSINNTTTTGNTDTTTNTEGGGEDTEIIQQWLNATVTLADGPNMYSIIKQLDHDSRSFTEGLTYNDGILYESIGLNSHSAVLVLDPNTGTILQQTTLGNQYFGEGLTYRDGTVIQLTWKARTGFIYNASDITQAPQSFTFTTTTTEGWGLTYDATNDELIVSDGSDYIHFWDAVTMIPKRRIRVIRQNNRQSNNINELEYWRHRIIANIWYEDTIIVINPETGIVEKEYDFSQLFPENERSKQRADVLNGISISADPDLLYVTGKYWDRMFLIRLNY